MTQRDLALHHPPSVWLRFGRCELFLQRRELRLDGVLQPIEPKVYDLLLMLVQHRQRVVTKKELATALWQGSVLSDSVLARTVMKARRAIGDSGAAPRWIRSLHGVGYRFVGDLSEAPAPAAMPQLDAPKAPRSRLRIGVLPCANASGDTALDWTRVGLMALVVHALQEDTRLAPVPVMTMLDALPGMPLSATPQERAQMAFEVLRLDHVVHATLRRQRRAVWLDHSIYGRDGSVSVGSFCEADALALGEQLVKVVSTTLFAGRAAALTLLSRDAFINQAFARAVECFSREDWNMAAPLFEVVCRMEPDSLAALHWRVMCLSLLEDAAAVPLAQTMLDRAAALGLSRLCAWAHVCLAYVLSRQRTESALQLSRMHRDAALRMTQGPVQPDCVIWLLVSLGVDAARNDDTAQAVHWFAKAESASRASGNAHRLSLVQQNIAVLEIGSGDLVSARQRLEEASQVHRRLRRHKSAAHTLAWLGVVNASLGLLDVAVEQCDDALSQLGDLRGPGWVGPVMAATVLVYSELADQDRIARVLTVLEEAVDVSHPLMHAPLLAARGALAISRGEIGAARQHLQSAVDHARSGIGAPLMRAWLGLWLRAEAAAGDTDGLAALCQHIAELPGSNATPELRACLLHAQAALHLHAGETDAAAALLGQIIEQVPIGREHACARLDAAWLCLERDEVDRAGHLLASVNAWRREHPVGLAVQARWLYASGQHQAAVAAQRRALDRHRGPAPAWQHQALRTYAAAQAGDSFQPMPAPPSLPRLASDAWWPQPASHHDGRASLSKDALTS